MEAIHKEPPKKLEGSQVPVPESFRRSGSRLRQGTQGVISAPIRSDAYFCKTSSSPFETTTIRITCSSLPCKKNHANLWAVMSNWLFYGHCKAMKLSPRGLVSFGSVNLFFSSGQKYLLFPALGEEAKPFQISRRKICEHEGWTWGMQTRECESWGHLCKVQLLTSKKKRTEAKTTKGALQHHANIHPLPTAASYLAWSLISLASWRRARWEQRLPAVNSAGLRPWDTAFKSFCFWLPWISGAHPPCRSFGPLQDAFWLARLLDGKCWSGLLPSQTPHL